MKYYKPFSKTIRDSFWLSAGQYLAQVCISLRSFFAANYLGPNGFGLWSKVLYYIEYAQFLTLGMDININREINHNPDKNKIEFCFLYKIFYKYFIKILTFSSLLTIAVIFFIRYSNLFNNAEFKTHIVIFYFVAINLVLLMSFTKQIILALGFFKYTALIRFSGAASSLIIVILTCRTYGIYGMFLSYISIQLVPLLIILLIFRKKINETANNFLKHEKEYAENYGKFDLRTFIKNSLSLITLFFFFTLWIQYDRLFVTIIFGNKDTGLYFFPSNIINGIGLIISSFSTVIYRKICLDYGKNPRANTSFSYILKAIQKICIIYPLVLITAYYFYPFIVNLFFRSYIDSVYVFHLLLVSSTYIALVTILYYFYMSIKKQSVITKYLTLFLLISGVGYITFAKIFSIKEYPIFVLFSNYTLTLLLILKAKSISSSSLSTKKMIFSISFPLSVALISVLLFKNFSFSLMSYNLIHGVPLMFVKLLLSLLLYIALVSLGSYFFVDKQFYNTIRKTIYYLLPFTLKKKSKRKF